jgi:hypothetical protein
VRQHGVEVFQTLPCSIPRLRSNARLLIDPSWRKTLTNFQLSICLDGIYLFGLHQLAVDIDQLSDLCP